MPAVELQYDQLRIAWHRRKRVRRIALLLAAAGFLLVCGWSIPPIVRRARFYRLQQATAATPTLAGQLLVTTSTTRPAVVATSLINAASQFLPVWGRERSWGLSPTPGAPLFVHQRTTVADEKRIVMVYAVVSPPTPDGRRDVRLESHAYSMMSMSWIVWPDNPHAFRSFSDIGSTLWRITLNPGDTLDIFAGEVDPADTARLLIPYRLNGMPYQFEARLTDNTLGWNGQANAGLVFTRKDPLLADYPGAGDGRSLSPRP